MFDFDASKLIIIGIVALIVIGPKELPRVLRQLGQAVSKMRRMGAEFQNQFMDAMREAEVTDIKADLAKLKDSSKFDLPHFNPVQDIRREMTAAVETAPATAALPSTLSIVSPDRVHAGSEEPPKIEAPRTFDPLPSPAHESQNAVSQPPALFDESGAKISPPETQAGV